MRSEEAKAAIAVPKLLSEVGADLRRMRESWNLSIDDLAELSGVHARTIQAAELGADNTRRITVQTISKIANAMGCDLLIEVKFRG